MPFITFKMFVSKNNADDKWFMEMRKCQNEIMNE